MALNQTVFRALYLTLCLPMAAASAGVYKCLDEKQKAVYQDRPCQEMTSARLSPELSRLAPETSRQHLLWKAAKDKATLYIFGSLGYATATMYPLPEAIMDVFSSAQVLVVAPELRELPRSEADAIARGTGRYSDATSLSAHLKPATWERILAVANALGVTEEAIAPEKPWLAGLTLKSAALKRQGFDQNLSLSKSLISSAGTAKPILELDPLDKQLEGFEGLSAADQEQILLLTVNEADESKGIAKSMLDAWQSGDSEAVAITQRRLLDSVPGAKSVADRFLLSRNEGIANKLEELSADGRTYFVVVSAERLVAEKGLNALLETKGFKLSQL